MNINQLSCAQVGGNTGVSSCYFDPKQISGIILTPVGYTITDTAITTAGSLSALLNLAVLADRASRIFPINGFVGITDNSEDVTTQTLGYGSIDVVREGFYSWTLQFKRGGLCLHTQLRKFNNQALGILLIDAAGVIIGERVTGGLRSIDLESFYVPKFTINTGSANTAYNVRIVFDGSGLNDRPGFQVTSDLGFNVKNLMGLIQVAFDKISRSTNIITVRVKAACGSTNLYDQYTTELANPSAYYITNAATGNQITVTSVAADANSKGFALTLNSSDPDYTTGGINVSLSTPQTLDTLGITGYESNTLLVTT